jgi:hypothetical protein
MTKSQNVQKVKTYKKSKRTKSQNVQKVKTYKNSKRTKSQNVQKVKTYKKLTILILEFDEKKAKTSNRTRG